MQLGSFIMRALLGLPKSFLSQNSRLATALLFALAAVLGSGFSSFAEAATVTQVKGANVLIDGADSGGITEGTKYFVVVGGKKSAVIQITKVKGSKAIAKIIKGTAAAGGSVVGAAKGGKTAGRKRRSEENTPFGDMTVGAYLGYSMDSQTVKQTNTTLSMSGSGISLKGFGDLPISGSLGATVRAGFEQFGVTTSANGTSYSTKITYLTGDLLLRYHFMEGSIVPFASIGVGIYFPMSKSSNSLIESQISATTVLLVNAGLNYSVTDAIYVSGIAEYGLFPPSGQVTTNVISLRGGVGYHF